MKNLIILLLSILLAAACNPQRDILLESLDYAEPEVYQSSKDALQKRMKAARVKFREIIPDSDNFTIALNGVRTPKKMTDEALEQVLTRKGAIDMRPLYRMDENGLPNLLEEFFSDFPELQKRLSTDPSDPYALVLNQPDYQSEVLPLMWQEKYIRLLNQSLDFVWGRPDAGVVRLYALPTKIGLENALANEHIKSAKAGNQNGIPIVEIQFTDQGKETFARLTRELANDNQRALAIVVDGRVISNPSVMEAITGGKVHVSGLESVEEAKELASIFMGGMIPLQLKLK